MFAGTERGAFVSFDDGDRWQPFQLNLPVTSVRDFEIYNNDLIVATHGRGFWVIDDISPLRQINETVLASNAFLFKPADAINYAQGGDNGTPLQKDEPQALNPPNGAVDRLLPQDGGDRSGRSRDSRRERCNGRHIRDRERELSRRKRCSAVEVEQADAAAESQTRQRSGDQHPNHSPPRRGCTALCGIQSRRAVGEVVAAAVVGVVAAARG